MVLSALHAAPHAVQTQQHPLFSYMRIRSRLRMVLEVYLKTFAASRRATPSSSCSFRRARNEEVAACLSSACTQRQGW